MRALAILLTIATCGGDGFETLRPGFDVVVSEEVDPANASLIADGVAKWTEAVPGSIGTVTVGPRPSRCGTVFIRHWVDASECDSSWGNGCTYSDGCRATILLAKRSQTGAKPDAIFTSVVAHELGHVLLGEEDSDVRGSMLSVPTWDENAEDRKITADEAEQVRDAMK